MNKSSMGNGRNDILDFDNEDHFNLEVQGRNKRNMELMQA